MKFFVLINHKLLTTANSFLLNIAEYEIFSANRYENANLEGGGGVGGGEHLEKF